MGGDFILMAGELKIKVNQSKSWDSPLNFMRRIIKLLVMSFPAVPAYALPLTIILTPDTFVWTCISRLVSC